MKSTYLDNVFSQFCSERNKLLEKERNASLEDVKKYESKIVALAGFNKYIVVSLIFGVCIGIFCCFIIGWIGLILGVLMGVGINFVIMNGWNAVMSDENKKIQKAIEERESECEEKCASINYEYDLKIKEERDNYNYNVKKAIEYYAQSDNMNSMVEWLCDSLQAKLLSQKKDSYIKHIEATVAYRVEEKGIELLEKMPHSNEYKKVSDFNFHLKRFYDVSDFFKRVGLAKVLSKRVEVEVKKLSLNGLLDDSFRNSATITIDNDDTFISISYKTLNPNYRPPVII